MYEAARIQDPVEHSFALAGLIGGAVVGLVVGVALLSNPVGWVAIAGAAIAVGGSISTGAFIGEMAGSFCTHEAGKIETGAKTVFIGADKRPAARAKIDKVDCDKGMVIAQGSRVVFIENFPAARAEDKTECDGKIAEGHKRVHIGREPGTYVKIKSEVPWQLQLAVFLIGLPSMVTGLWKLGAKIFTKGSWKFLRGLPGKIKGGFSKLWNGLKTRLGHPVDVATGDVVDEATDLSLPGPIPVVWSRDYSSSRAYEETALGIGGWAHCFEQWVVEDGDLWTLRAEGGRDIYFEKVGLGESTFHRRERLTLRVEADGAFTVYSDSTRQTRAFAPLVDGGKAVLRSIRDPYGNTVNLYYENERLVSVEDTAGRAIRVHNDSLGRVVRLEVWAGGGLHQWVDYFYHPSGELAAAVNALSHADRFEYDARHRMTKVTLKNGVSFYYEYDPEHGRCVRSWGDDGLHTIELSYDLELGTTTVQGNGEPRIYYWDDSGLVRRETTLDGRCLRVVDVDDDGFVVAEGVTEAELTRHEYDTRGNLIKTIDPAGNATTWEYAGDRPVRRTAPDGLATLYEHDARGALSEVTYPTGAPYSLAHDLHGRLVKIREGDRSIAEFGYDREHNAVREVDARGATTTLAYDALGRPIERKDALGRVTRIEYDVLGQPVAIQYPDGTVTRAEYEPLGNIARAIDTLGQVSELEYTGTGVFSRLVQPDGTVWSMQYDRDERLTRILNPAGERYEFMYDDAGRVVSERTFDGRSLRYVYNELNRLAASVNPAGNVRHFEYDPLGNVLADRSMESSVAFERDKLGRLNKAVLTERSGKVVTELRRDPFGRVIEELQNGKAIRFAYDENGRRVERVLPDGSKTRYGYDAGDELSYVEHDGRRFDFERDLLGREAARRAIDGGVAVRSAYDEMDRLVERHVAGGAAHSALSKRTWKYDALGRVREIGDARWGATVYQYDRIGQLIEAKRGSYREAFQYDITGSLRNILAELGGTEAARAWDTKPGNLLTRTEKARYEYDACGRRTKKVARVDTETERFGDVTTYVWDELDRLREVRRPNGQCVMFTYDAFGRRVRKEVMPSEGAGPRRVVEFLWDADELASDSDSVHGARVFVHEPGTFVPMLQAEQGEVFVVVNDHLGMPKELVDRDGQVAWAAVHSAWGRVLETVGDASRKGRPIECPFRLLGQYADEETGLCSTTYRYFDADAAIWCSPDPLGIIGGNNHFSFGGSPTEETDPYGLCLLQRATNIANAQIIKSPSLIRSVLSTKELAAAQRSWGIATMQYGNVVERLAAQNMRNSWLYRRLFTHVGGPGKPDFIGKGILKGLNFDITTEAQIAKHLSRPYGKDLIITTYKRATNFFSLF